MIGFTLPEHVLPHLHRILVHDRDNHEGFIEILVI